MPEERKKEHTRVDAADVIGGTLNILGFKIDLGQLIASPEELRGQLEELRRKLQEAGGRETLSDEDWQRGVVSGYISTRGLLGRQEFHIGTAGGRARGPARAARGSAETVEPAVDVFDEADEVTLVANVPGVGLEDLELSFEEGVLRLATKSGARRQYRKEIRLAPAVDPTSLLKTCHNGVLEVRLRKLSTGGGEGAGS